MSLTCVVGGTKTSVVVDPVDAGGAVLAVVVFAFVSVGLARWALKAQRTLAAVTACKPMRPVSLRIVRSGRF